MTNNSDVYWTANGLSLHTLAWSVKSFGGRRFFGPSKRGSNLDIPFNRGQLYLPKSRNAQAYDLNMWVLPLNQDGTRSDTLTRAEMAHLNWRTIVSAVDVEGEFDLVKRWYNNTSIVSATARAEFVDGSGPDSDDGRGFYFNLQMMLADPYFYVPVSAASVSTGTLVASGEVPTDHVKITMTAGSTQPTITFNDGNWIHYNGTVSGTPLIIDCKAGTAKIGSIYVNGLITRNPAFAEWPRIFPGSNSITFVNTGGGSPAGTLQYDAAYR